MLLQKIKNVDKQLWHTSKKLEHVCSKSMFIVWIENDLYLRKAKAITNFKNAISLNIDLRGCIMKISNGPSKQIRRFVLEVLTLELLDENGLVVFNMPTRKAPNISKLL